MNLEKKKKTGGNRLFMSPNRWVLEHTPDPIT